ELIWGDRAGRVLLATLPDGWQGEKVAQLPTRLLGVGHKGPVTALAAPPDSPHLLSAGEDGLIRRAEIASGRDAGSFAGPGRPVRRMVAGPGGQRLLSAGDDGGLWVWDLTSPTALPPSGMLPPEKAPEAVVRTINFKGRVTGVAFLDGDREALSAAGAHVRRHELSSGKELFASPATKGTVRRMSVDDGEKALLFHTGLAAAAQ